MGWKDLSIRDKAAIIRQSVSDGIYNLGEIRNKFENGGNLFSGKDKNQPTQKMNNHPIWDWKNTVVPQFMNYQPEPEISDNEYTSQSNIDIGAKTPEELKRLAQSKIVVKYNEPQYDNRLGVWVQDEKVLPASYIEHLNNGDVRWFEAGNPEPVQHLKNMTDTEEKIWKNKYDTNLAQYRLQRTVDSPYLTWILNEKNDDRWRNDEHNIWINTKNNIKITNAGELTGTKIPKEFINIAAEKSKQENFPLKTLLAIAGNETHFGALPSTTFLTPSQISEHYKAISDYPEPDRNYKSAAEILNNHHFTERSVWNDELGEIIRQYKKTHNVDAANYWGVSAMHTPSNGFIDAGIDKEYIDIDEDLENLAKKAYLSARYKKADTTDPIIDAIRLYKSGKYNSGDSGYMDRINKWSNDLWESPELQEYLKSIKYSE